MNSVVEISDNLITHNKLFVDNDVSFGSHLEVHGDASFNQNVEIMYNLNIRTDAIIVVLTNVKDTTFLEELDVSKCILNNLFVYNDIYLEIIRSTW